MGVKGLGFEYMFTSLVVFFVISTVGSLGRLLFGLCCSAAKYIDLYDRYQLYATFVSALYISN